MKKFYLLFTTLIGLFLLTGCGMSFDNFLNAQNSILAQENVVFTLERETIIETNGTKRIVEEKETYVFSNNYAIITLEYSSNNTSGSSYSDTYYHTEEIYDFENEFKYTCNGESGKYYKTTLSSTYTYEYLYKRYVNITSTYMFYNGDVTNVYEEENGGSIIVYKLTGSSSKLTIKANVTWVNDNYEESRTEKTVYNFKTTKISIPSDSKIVS